MTAMGRPPLFIHIGLQKTGTSYLQSIFWQNVDELRRQGLDMTPDTKRATFNLMLDVRGRFDPEFDPDEAGRAVDQLPRILAKASGTRALITEESLAPAKDDQIQRLLAASADREVHVVVTVRDLGGQIPSSWQQALRSGADESFDAYLKRLRRNEGKAKGRLWMNKDIPKVLGNWSRFVPPERIHVVTVPPSGSDPLLLLQRFCHVLDVDHTRLNTNVARSNESLKHIGAEVLRRVNANLDQEFRRRDVYGDVGKRFLAAQILGRMDGRRIRLPKDMEEWVRSVSARHIEFLAQGGFHVVGDLTDLEPPGDAFVDDDLVPSEAEVAAASTEALADVLTVQMRRLRNRRRTQPGSRPRRLARRALATLRR
jgi:hypothetical protein